MKKCLKSNAGFSMIELLAVLAISALIMGVAGFSLAMTPASQAKKCTLNFDAMMTRTRSGTLAKEGAVYMEIKMDSVGRVVLNYYEDGKLYDSEILSEEEKVEIAYDTNGTATDVKLTEGTSLYLGFDRNTTAFLTLGDAATRAGKTVNTGVTSTDYCTKIWIRGGEVEYYIDLGPKTGTHYPSIG